MVSKHLKCLVCFLKMIDLIKSFQIMLIYANLCKFLQIRGKCIPRSPTYINDQNPNEVNQILLRVTFCKTDTPEIHDPPPPRFL